MWWLRRLFDGLAKRRRRRRTRIMLEACDERILRDIGVRLDWRRQRCAAAVDERRLRGLDGMR